MTAPLKLVTNDPAVRTCTKCGVAKPVSDFHPRRDRAGKGRGALMSACKECHRATQRSAYHADIEKSRAYHRKKKRGYYSKKRDFDPVRWMLGVLKARARRAGIPFDLAPPDVFIPEHCPVLGLKLRRPGDGSKDDSPSFDRIDPRKGYVRGNVTIISMRANRLKSDATVAELERVARWMRSVGAP